MTAVYDTRELGMAALFALINSAANFATAKRTFEAWDAVPSADRPALRWLETPEDRLKSFNGGPATIVGTAVAWVYWNCDLSDLVSNPPAKQMNFLLASLDAKLQPSKVTGRQDLGLYPQVQDVWVEGQVFKDSGDIDGTGLIAVPIKILLLP